MSTRKIKDAKDLSTNELIYFKGHAQATYMSDGRTVEEAVNSMSGGSNEDSDIFILDLFNVVGYPEVDDLTNTGEIEFTVDSELISLIYSAIQKSKLVIRVDCVDLYNLEIDAYNSSRYYWFINSHFEWMGEFVKLEVQINTSELRGVYSISTVNAGSGGSVDTSNFVTSVKVDNVSKTPSSGVVDLGYINKKLTTSTSSSMTLSPNIYYRNTSTSLSTLTITLGSASNSNIINEYFVEFTTRSSGTTVSLPSTIKWANGETPTFEASTTYQISIVNNLGTIQKFK